MGAKNNIKDVAKNIIKKDVFNNKLLIAEVAANILKKLIEKTDHNDNPSDKQFNKNGIQPDNKVNDAIECVNQLIDAFCNKKDLIDIPEIDLKKIRFTKDMVSETLERKGINFISKPLDIKDADISYRNYIDNQVVNIYIPSKNKKKLNKNDTIIFIYITQEIIDKSEELYLQSENKKQEEINNKKKKNEKLVNNAKKIIIKTPLIIKDKVNDVKDIVVDKLPTKGD